MRSTSHSFGSAGALTALVMISFALLCFGPASATAASSPWSPVSLPWDKSSPINDMCAFGTAGLAVAGDGRIGITRDGGSSWTAVVPGGLQAAVFTAIAVDPSGRAIVASGGLLLVTDDWGSTWRTPSYVGPGPGAAINDIALRGSQAVAVGDNGLIMSSGDGGTTWTRLASPTASPITCVAIAGDGTAIAGSSAGEILVGSANVWTVAGTVAGPVTSVAASDVPVWGDGRPDLFAATGHDVLGSDDARTFASLPGLPDLSSQPWPSLAWLGVPAHSLLVAGTPDAAFFDPIGGLWLTSPTGLGGTAGAVVPDGQSVAYLLGTDGSLLRTLSAGREAATIQPTPPLILVGAATHLTATVRVGAPGVVLLLQRVPGSRWVTTRTIPWTSGDWNRSLSFSFKPSLTHEYLLAFKYGKTTVTLAPAATVIVTPKISTTQSGFKLRVGDVFRFSGSVTPALPGEKLDLFTDRGGSWRRVSRQGSVKLPAGQTWTSRRFGTPKAETYHLRAHLAATSTHGEAWSRVVTVTIR
jgi:photosystem II stability/assembly factor-like uncharacterized protein